MKHKIGRGGFMKESEKTTEELRQRILNAVYAGAFAGLDAMILDIPDIEQASSEELLEIAQRYGIK